MLGPEVEHLQERFKDEGTYGGTHRARAAQPGDSWNEGNPPVAHGPICCVF